MSCTFKKHLWFLKALCLYNIYLCEGFMCFSANMSLGFGVVGLASSPDEVKRNPG